jgi:hypothetical protein
MYPIGFWSLHRNVFPLLICTSLAAATLSPAWAQENPSAPLAPDIAAANLLRAGVDENQLKPGEFVWLPAVQPDTGAPLMIIVNLSAQRAYVYRDGEPIAVTTISTGRPGRETPTGTFEILAKERMHHSNIYDDAAMPFMQRLTWSGLTLHAGHLPGYPASHGCVRLPEKFAQQLFDLTETGETVVISDDGSAEALARAGLDMQVDLPANSASTVHAIVGAVGPAPALDSTARDGATRAIAEDTDATYSDAP